MQTIKWGILGTARIAASQLIPALRESGYAEVMAVASRNKEKAQKFAHENQIPRVYGSYESLIQDPEIEAVYIPLPNHMHAEWTIKAAQNGKHVLCEKPIALNTEQVSEMAKACKQADIIFMEAFMYRYHLQWDKVSQLIHANEIGNIKTVNAHFSFHLEDYYDIRFSPTMGGGALYDLGAYCVNAIQLIMKKLPIDIYAMGHFAQNGTVDHTLSAMLKYDENCFAHLYCSFDAFEKQQIEIVGDKGTITVNLPFLTYRGAPQVTVRKKEMQTVITFEECNMYAEQVKHFCSCILSGKAPAYDIEQSIDCMKVIDRIYRSAGRLDPI